jgi:hypothetical protein
MMPQANFMVAAPIATDREGALRALLAAMNLRPGVVDPNNALFPFRRFDRLHVARFVILDDQTLDDLPPGDPLRDAPPWLVFLGDCDGAPERLLAEFVAVAEAGLRAVFSHCADFSTDADLLSWMHAHSVRPAAQYVNWVGRTVRQIREEAALRAALAEYLARDEDPLASTTPLEVRDQLVAYHRAHGPCLSPAPPTPLRWRVSRFLNLIGVPLALLLLAPFLMIYAPLYLWQLRSREASDPVIAPQPSAAHVAILAALEDHDVTNQFSAFGSVKPGRFRLRTLLFVFWVLDFSTRQIYTRGRLARVGTIHFARWVFLDNKRRLLFASNYDGSLDSYMDDFINKVAYGLNLVFSNGIGYPRTKFLLCGGAQYEQEFKNYLRRHEVPTQVWYKAYPGLTTADLARNTLIREGLVRDRPMSDAEARQWLALI